MEKKKEAVTKTVGAYDWYGEEDDEEETQRINQTKKYSEGTTNY